MANFGSRRTWLGIGFVLAAVMAGIVVWSIPACACTPALDEESRQLGSDPTASAGSLMRALASAQERYREAHSRYAPTLADLGVPTTGWEVEIDESSPTPYRMRVMRGIESCAFWAGRGHSHSGQAFLVDCDSGPRAPEARRDSAAAPHN
jgi:hypothetical protein